MRIDEHPGFNGGQYTVQPNHPGVSLILLLFLMAVGYFVFGGLSIFIALATTNVASLSDLMATMEGAGTNAAALKVIQAGSSIGMFVLPPLLLPLLERRRSVYLNHTAPVPPSLWLIVIALMFFAAPIIELSIQLNEAMRLPAALADLEAWMQEQELKMEKLTHLFLADTTYAGLLINLVVIAVIPAIGEEFLFRGCLQGILIRWFRSPHVAIWVCAIIFSAIHMQFYGFLPRMLLGALFGYLLFWGKNIWLPIFAHFLNNAAATLSAFYLQRQGKGLEEINFGDQIPFYVYLLSVAMATVLLYQYRKTAQTQRN